MSVIVYCSGSPSTTGFGLAVFVTSRSDSVIVHRTQAPAANASNSPGAGVSSIVATPSVITEFPTSETAEKPGFASTAS